MTTTRYDRLRQAADDIEFLARIKESTIEEFDKPLDRVVQLRADADELAALEGHLRTLRATTWGDAGQYVTDVANRIRGDK